MRRDALTHTIKPTDAPLYPKLTGWQRTKARLSLLFVDHALFRTFFNTRSKISDEMWRSSNPLPYQIASAARAGIRTIINLRGASETAFYRLEEEAAQKNGVTLVNFVIYSREAPLASTVLAAKDLFETIEYPALMHCKSGADRAGLMSALYLIFRKGWSVEATRRQLSMAYGHVRQAKTGILDFFFTSYLQYNAKTPIPFLDWVTTVYDRDEVTKNFRSQWLAGLITDKILRRE